MRLMWGCPGIGAGQELRATKEGICKRIGCGLVGDKAHVHNGGGGKEALLGGEKREEGESVVAHLHIKKAEAFQGEVGSRKVVTKKGSTGAQGNH